MFKITGSHDQKLVVLSIVILFSGIFLNYEGWVKDKPISIGEVFNIYGEHLVFESGWEKLILNTS